MEPPAPSEASPRTPTVPLQAPKRTQLLRMQETYKIDSMSPARIGLEAGPVGASPAVKMQRSKEWTSGEINAVFFNHSKHRTHPPGVSRKEDEASQDQSPSLLQSQWMRRHSPLAASRLRVQGGDGLPPNKLNLRQVINFSLFMLMT